MNNGTQHRGLEEVQRVLAYLLPRIPALVKLSAPIWPTEARTLYHRWQQGTLGDLPLRVIRYDASPHGVAMTFQCDPNVIRHRVGRRFEHVKCGMGSRKYKACNRWKRARKGLLHKER